MGRLHLEHLLLIRVRVSGLRSCEIGLFADFISMKAFNELPDLRRFEPVIRSERVGLHQHRFQRPTLQTELPDLFLQNRTKYSVRGPQNQGRHIERVQTAPSHSFFGAGLIHRDLHCQGYPRYLAVRYARAVCNEHDTGSNIR